MWWRIFSAGLGRRRYPKRSGLYSRRPLIEQLEDRCLLASAADIVFLVDESGSTAETPLIDWLADMVGQLDTELSNNGIIDRRYGLVGFGATTNSQRAHTHLVDPDDVDTDDETYFGSASQLSTAALALEMAGEDEDGWDAIEHTVAEYDFQPGAAVMFVLLQGDFERTVVNPTLTQEGIFAALKSHNITLYSVTIATFDPDMGDFVYGVEAPADGEQGSDQIAYVENAVPNGNPTIPAGVFRDGPHELNGGPEYVRLAWKTGGAAWNYNIIVDDVGFPPTALATFNEFFVNSFAEKITSKLTAHDVAFDDDPILEVNLGGPAIGSFLADNDASLGASFLTGTAVAALVPSPLPTISPNGNSIDPSVPLNVFQTAQGTEAVANPNFANMVINVPSTLVPDGAYVVELLFAGLGVGGEGTYYGTFDVILEGQEETPVLLSYRAQNDWAFITEPNNENEVLVRTLNGNEPIVKRFFVNVTDGLQIELRSITEGQLPAGAQINGLRVLKVPSAPPQITDVILSGVMPNNQAWLREPYSFADIVPTGKQLAPIYTQGVNTIQIKFSEHVLLDDNALTLYGTGARHGETTLVIDHIDYDYNPNTHVATWTFPILGGDKYRIDILASDVTDLDGSFLDGHWDNLTRGTLEDWTNDPDGRTFLSGNGIGGSSFQFLFALLPGDYNQNGVVDAADETVWSDTESFVDGDGDGDEDQDDRALWASHLNELLALRRSFADYKDDDNVDTGDYMVWRATFGMTGDNLAADGDGDGIVWANDYTLFVYWENTKGAWHIPMAGLGSLLPIVDFGNAPRVANVTISGSQSTHNPYSFDAHDGSGEQLRTVPVGGADTISIAFSEDVNVVESHLRLIGLYTANTPTVAEFVYDIGTMTATWRFEGWVLADQYLITLSDAVTDIEGNRLDGEWTNPASLSTTNAAVSEFPSGDSEAGGRFNFIATLLPGDANGDLTVSFADYSILASHWGWTNTQFIYGDFNGDGTVSIADYSVLLSNYGLNLQNVWVLADLNGDFAVDELDADILAENIGVSNPTWADGDLNDDGYVDINDLDLMFAQYGLELSVVS